MRFSFLRLSLNSFDSSFKALSVRLTLGEEPSHELYIVISTSFGGIKFTEPRFILGASRDFPLCRFSNSMCSSIYFSRETLAKPTFFFFALFKFLRSKSIKLSLECVVLKQRRRILGDDEVLLRLNEEWLESVIRYYLFFVRSVLDFFMLLEPLRGYSCLSDCFMPLLLILFWKPPDIMNLRFLPELTLALSFGLMGRA